MPETSLTLIVAALLFAFALFVWLGARRLVRRAGVLQRQLLAMDERLVLETPVVAARLGAQRADLAALSSSAERALWSLSHLDERLEATRTRLAARRAQLDRDRARLVAARANVARLVRTAQMLMKVLELRRAILG